MGARATAPDLLDRRQRLAAALILSAVDLPAELSAFAALTLQASAVCPGLTVDEVLFGQGRRAGLLRARDLIDAMLAEQA